MTPVSFKTFQRFLGSLPMAVGLLLAMAAVLLLMTYYGVSFYLVGLHSYAGGNAKPLPALLIVYLVLEAAFMAAIGSVALSRRRVGAASK